MRLTWLWTVGVAVTVACSSSGTGSSSGCKSTAADVTIQATDAKQFSPDTLQIGRTQTVCWENNGTLTHSVTFDNDTTTDVTLAPGFVALKTFGVNPGDFKYHCRYHIGMVGLIQVR